MALYFEINAVTFVEWLGEPINGIRYPPIIEHSWDDAKLLNLGLYKPQPADPVPDGFVIESTFVARVDGVVKYVNVLKSTNVETGHVHPNASSTQGGFMSAANYSKLAAVEAEATKNKTDGYLLTRGNHTGSISADEIIDGVVNKLFLATDKAKLAGIAAGATANLNDSALLDRTNHTGAQLADTIIDGIVNKVFTSSDKNKLGGIAANATANSSDATLLNRANHTGTQLISSVSGLQGALDAKVSSSQIGANNGVAPLDALGRVPAVNLPSYVDDVMEYANLAGFPGTGESGKIYIALDTNKTYRWSGSAYVEISSSPGTTDVVVEGSANKYFTEARVLATTLTGYFSVASASIGATDTVFTAFQKVQAQINFNKTISNLTGVLNDSALPARLRAQSLITTDWDNAVENGTYTSNAAANEPVAGLYWVGHVRERAGQHVIQDLIGIGGTSAGTQHWRRHKESGVWEAWFQVLEGVSELDARYARVGQAVTLGDINITDVSPSLTYQRTTDANGSTLTFNRADGTANWIAAHVSNADGEVPNGWVVARRNASGGAQDRPIRLRDTDGRTFLGTVAGGVELVGTTTAIGDLVIDKSWPQMRLDKTANTQTSSIAGTLNDINLWNFVLGEGNAAGDMAFNAYTDAGAYRATVARFNRLNSDFTTYGNHLFAKDYAETRWLTASGRGWRAISGANGSNLDEFHLQGTTDNFGTNFVNSLSIDSSGVVRTQNGFKFIKCIQIAQGADLNTIVEAGVYDISTPVNGPYSGPDWWYLEVVRHSNNDSYVMQVASLLTGTTSMGLAVWRRFKKAGSWGPWVPVSGLVTPQHFGAAPVLRPGDASTNYATALQRWLDYEGPRMLDGWYMANAAALRRDMALTSQNGFQIFGVGMQSGIRLDGGSSITVDQLDESNPTGTVFESVTMRDFGISVNGYSSAVPLQVAFVDNDTGSSMPGIQMDNIHIVAQTTASGSSAHHLGLHNVRNGAINNVSIFGRYGTYNGIGINQTGGPSSASVEVYFNNCRANHVQTAFKTNASSGAVANDDMQGIHWNKCTAIAVDRGWDLASADGFSEWMILDGCHAYFREIGVYGQSAGNIRSNHGYFLGHGSLATCQGIAITGTSIEPWNALTFNRIRLDAATGATRIGINANAQTGYAIGNRVTNATSAYTFGAGWTQTGNT